MCKCSNCGQDINKEEEHYLIYWIDYLENKLFCDEECLISYLKEVGEVELK